jgi:hypothetical protein
MPIIRQTIKGRTVKSLDVEATAADLTALQALLAGEVSVFDLQSTGGSTAPYPTDLNRKRFSCGSKLHKISCSFNIQHMKPTAHIADVEAVVVGAFDASYDSSIKATYTNLLYDKN